jgi:3-dehydrosphinganine reductase
MHPPPPVERNATLYLPPMLEFCPITGYNAYSPAKAAVRSLADGLRQKCLLYEIDVYACFPTTIYTPGFEEEQKTKLELTNFRGCG